MNPPTFEPRNPDFDARVRESFARQAAMRTLGATLAVVEPGRVEITLPWAEAADAATRLPARRHGGHRARLGLRLRRVLTDGAEAAVLTIEFKINLLAPAQGQRFRMVGTVVKPGRTVTVCEGHAYAIDGGQEKLVATMGCTLMAVVGRDNIQG